MLTTAEPTTGETFLVYDGDCPMCQSTVGMLFRLKLVRPDQTRSNHELQGADLETAQSAGIRNQLVVIDPHTREARSGTDGLLWIIGENFGNPLWIRVLRLPGVRQIVRWTYQSISYNRRIISPPRHQIVCDCEPEVTVGRRLSLVLPVVVFTVALAAAFGAALFYGAALGSDISGVGFALTALAGGAGALAVASGVLLPRDKRLDYVAHLAVTLFMGTLVLLPGGLLALVVPRNAALAIVALAVAASCGLMFAMQQRRVAALAISPLWKWAFLFALTISVSAAAYFYLGT